jgi:polysaccharide pyruvyl transferase WcaK-like protein
MLDKPVVALSYHEKITSLMAAVGMGEYCQSIDQLDVDLLVRQFIKLEQDSGIVKPLIEQKIDDYRRALDRQYAGIFNHPSVPQ